MAAAKPATVRVLHRAVGSDEEDSSPHAAPGSPQLTMQELQAANQSLKQRLEQVGTHCGTMAKAGFLSIICVAIILCRHSD